ncbi:MAG: adenylyl-sulfate kinase, partial [Oscillospiraceae bacterium]|nr:adenylyl-sulfate kinase [Oscillospiraceae bacterium]
RHFRMCVQDVYKFTSDGDDRRIIAGTIDSGTLKAGDEIIFYPSGKHSTVNTLEVFNSEIPLEFTAGKAIGFTLTEQIYIRRGELAAKSNERPPHVSTRFKTSIFWLGRSPMIQNKTYSIKIGSSKINAQLDEIISTLNASTLVSEKKNSIERHEVAECIIKCERPAAFDLTTESIESSRFVIVDNYEISGGGIITESLPDDMTDTRELVLRRNYKWEGSSITSGERAERTNQRAALVLITGEKDTNKKEAAKKLERILFDEGRNVYFLGIGNVLYGVVAEIKTAGEIPERSEHIRRLGEVANLLLDAGMILLVTATEFTEHDLNMLKIAVDPEFIHTVWLGDRITTDIECDMRATDIEQIRRYLNERLVT